MLMIGSLFNLMLLCLAVEFVTLPIVFGIGYIIYKVIKRKKDEK